MPMLQYNNNIKFLVFDRKRYFVCPQKSGIFVLVTKIKKEGRRPSTPHTSTTSPKTPTNQLFVLPPVPIKKDQPPSPQPTRATQSCSSNNSLLSRIERLEAENKLLKASKENSLETDNLKQQLNHERAKNKSAEERIKWLEKTVEQVKRTGMESLDMLESVTTSHQRELSTAQSLLLAEKRRVQELLQEHSDLRKAGLEAIESYETTLAGIEKSRLKSKQLWDLERKRMQEEAAADIEFERKRATEKLLHEFNMDMTQLVQRHHYEIKVLLEDAEVLESVIQTNADKEKDLSESLKRERQYSSKLAAELKGIKFQIKVNGGYNSSCDREYPRDKLDTPVEDDDERCAICNRKDHDILHCTSMNMICSP
jgi:hypothetical protein